jgi:3-isopropylmalate/(R)-2-methylmalate dehydratase small subunit
MPRSERETGSGAVELRFLAGRAWKFANDIDTDAIIPGRYLVINEPKELAEHLFEGVRPEMAREVKEGDYVVGGENFGCGSSREHAPLALKGAGVKAMVAKSFARIFFRNSINIGLPLFICSDVDRVADGSEIEIDMAGGVIENRSRHESYRTMPLPDFLQEIVEAGGLVEYTRRQVREVKA